MAQEKRLLLVEVALKMRAKKFKAKSDAANRRRQKALRNRTLHRELLIERRRLEELRRLWRKRNENAQSMAKAVCSANKLRSIKSLQVLVDPARSGHLPPEAFTSTSACHLAYTKARWQHTSITRQKLSTASPQFGSQMSTMTFQQYKRHTRARGQTPYGLQGAPNRGSSRF